MAKSSGRNRYLRRSGQAGAGPGGPGGPGNANALAQAQEMLAKAQEELANTSVEGSAGGGAVRVTMNGDLQVVGVTIEQEVVDPDDVEMLQDLIMAAVRDASERAREIQQRSLGSLNIPGLGGG